MQQSYSCVAQSLNPVQQNPLARAVVSNNICGLMAIFIPSCLVLGAVLYKKYRAHRATVLCQQIETLEKLWRINPKQ